MFLKLKSDFSYWVHFSSAYWALNAQKNDPLLKALKNSLSHNMTYGFIKLSGTYLLEKLLVQKLYII